MRPPRVTEERNPEAWSAKVRVRIMFVWGTEVRPRRALEAFWRWEQTFERWTKDMMGGGWEKFVGWEGGPGGRKFVVLWSTEAEKPQSSSRAA